MTQLEALSWIAKTFDEPRDAITPATNRDQIAAWDSLGTLTLMSDLDQHFGILLTDEEIRSMRSVADILEVLRKHGKIAGLEHEIHPHR